MEIHVLVRAVFLELCPHPSIICTHDNLESIFIFISPLTRDVHFHGMGEVAMVIACESPDARALIFQ